MGLTVRLASLSLWHDILLQQENGWLPGKFHVPRCQGSGGCRRFQAHQTQRQIAMEMYHSGNRELQQEFGSTTLANRLVEKLNRSLFNDADKATIENATFFFLATANAEGQPDCSFKGGPKGFVKILAPDLLVFPDYDGNGMFKSLGNIKVNPRVGMLFIAMDETPRRLRVNGRAVLSLEDALIAELPGAQAIVRVTPEHIFPNCPRYIPNLRSGTESVYTPHEGIEPTEPAWKGFDEFREVVPPRRRSRS
jgi:predicted pyridoxine 5'-phosphate oxidase superfamily flavin-nucleotide-binding protein